MNAAHLQVYSQISAHNYFMFIILNSAQTDIYNTAIFQLRGQCLQGMAIPQQLQVT